VPFTPVDLSVRCWKVKRHEFWKGVLMHLLRRQEIDAGALDKLTETDGTSRGSGDFLFSHDIGLARSCTLPSIF
jgi:hypothetical protein